MLTATSTCHNINQFPWQLHADLYGFSYLSAISKPTCKGNFKLTVCTHSYLPQAHMLFSPVLTSSFMSLQSLPPICPPIRVQCIKCPRPDCVLTGSPLTSSRAILRGAEPRFMRPSKRQCHSKSTLEAEQHNLAPLQSTE